MDRRCVDTDTDKQVNYMINFYAATNLLVLLVAFFKMLL